MSITIKDRDGIQAMKDAGQVVHDVLESMKEWVKPGVTTSYLDKKAEELIRKEGAQPSFKGYGGYPASICTSIDSMVIHGIPKSTVYLEEGQIISVDVGAVKNGYQGDAARTYAVGKISEDDQQLIQAAEEAFFQGTKIIRPGRHLYEVSSRIQKTVEGYGYGVVRDYTGHGIGRQMHEDPYIPNYRPLGLRRGVKLREGMALAIEPMVTRGSPGVYVLSDGWGVKTRDGSKAAHYENTVLVTHDGYQILT